MNIETELKKEGITNIRPLDTLKINYIAKKVAHALVEQFPNLQFNENSLFIKLCRLNMYIATLPNTLASAKYYYKNSSIYFGENVDLTTINDCIIHECIHFLQETKNEKNNLIRLGLFECNRANIGIGINEAAVQYISSKCARNQMDSVKYFDIILPTISPSYYSLECNLIMQMLSITGEDCLVKSCLYGTDEFKNRFISLTNSDTYYNLLENIDAIMYAEDTLNELNLQLANCDENGLSISKISSKINKTRSYIQKTFIECQNTILKNYFNAEIKAIVSLDGIDRVRIKLYNYKELIGITDKYSYFNSFYIEKMKELELKYEELSNDIVSLTVPHKSLIYTLFKKLKTLFKLQNNTEPIKIHNR